MAKGARFPTFGLSEALDKAHKIYDREPHNEMSAEAAVKHMGYSGKNGASLGALATVRRYGLLEGRGEQIKVSRDAVTIFADEKNPDQSERIEAIQRCAKAPTVFADLSASFKGIPSVDTLVPALVKRGYVHSDAAEIAANYVATMEFVRKVSEGYNASSGTETPEQEQMNQPAVTSPGAPMINTAGSRNVQLPLSPTAWATLSAPFPLSEEAWTQMLAILNAMKPALVEPSKTV